MRTYLFEARQNRDGIGSNWGKFMVGLPSTEWLWRSAVDKDRLLLPAIGWTPGFIWACDLQTGEGAFFRPGGSAHADSEKHRIWVCPLFEPWLTWLYGQLGSSHVDLAGRLEALPRVVDLPDAEFAFAGYRRPGPSRGAAPGKPETPWVRQLREEAYARLKAWKVPQKGLAAHLGITEKHMSQVLTGKVVGSPELLDRLATAVGLVIRIVDVAAKAPSLPGRKPAVLTRNRGKQHGLGR